MGGISIAVVIILVLIVIALMLYNNRIHKKIETFNNTNQKIASLNVLQDFMDTLGEGTNVDDKIRKINEILIEKYEIKYSTIVVYDGVEYVIRASNVDQKHWETLRNLQSEEVFKDSVQTATPKYITVETENERLPYQKMEFGRAKCAMFFPLYVDNVYIGYWIIEGSKPHEFDKIDTTILEVVRNNIVSVLRTVGNQKIIENIVRDDQFSGLKSEEYLYGEGRRIIDKYTTSAVCLFRIINLEKINHDINRQTGNAIITEVAKQVAEGLSSDYVFVRYMGPKFAIVFSGIDVNGVGEFMKQIKEKVEAIEVEDPLAPEDAEEVDVASPKLNIVISTYYKGTALEGVTKKLEEYLDQADKNESAINYL